MRSRLPLAAAITVLLAASLSAWTFWKQPTTTPATAPAAAPSPETTPAAPAAASDPDEHAAPAPAIDVSTALPPMPEPGLPLAETVAALAARADAGDNVAACRVGAELARCAWSAWRYPGPQADASRHMALDAEANGRTTEAERSLRLADELEAAAIACADVPDAYRGRAARYLRQAALAGEPEAMLRYADGDDLFPAMSYDWLRSPDLDPWRRDAPALLQRSLQAGRPEAVLLLARAHVDSFSALGGLVPDDDAEARRWRALARRLLGEEADVALEDTVVPPADADADRIAEAEAEALHARLFAGRRWALADLVPSSTIGAAAFATSLAPGSQCGRAIEP